MEPLLAAIAAVQCGVFSRAQALSGGYSDKRIRHLLDVCTWVRRASGIYRLAGVATSFEMNAWIALLATGPNAVLSHRTAGKLYGLDGTPPPVRFDVSVPAARRPRNVPRAIVHRTELSDEDVAVCHGMPVTSLARTLVDLARTLPIETGSRVLADALRTGRRALASADPKLESVLERELFTLLRRAGLNPVAQFVVTAGGQFVARVDFALPNIRLAIEADGYGTHALRPGFERDREKAALLQLAGWSTLSFTANHIRQRPDWVIAVVLARVRQLSLAETQQN
jgi:very-short-patch-repair endonuclease